jgi:hypothetical protein
MDGSRRFVTIRYNLDGCNLTLPERRSPSTSAWDMETKTKEGYLRACGRGFDVMA